MKLNKMTFAALVLAATSLTSCIEEIDPQSSTVTIDQAASAPNSFNKFVSAITADMNGRPMMFSSSKLGDNNYDFGYPSQMIQRDLMGRYRLSSHCCTRIFHSLVQYFRCVDTTIFDVSNSMDCILCVDQEL